MLKIFLCSCLLMALTLPVVTHAEQDGPHKDALIALLREVVKTRQHAQMIQADATANRLSSVEKNLGNQILKLMREEIRAEIKSRKKSPATK